MSADDGVYVLQTKGPEFRVAYSGAIGNFFELRERPGPKLTKYLTGVWGRSDVYSTAEAAFEQGTKMIRSVFHSTEDGLVALPALEVQF